MYNEGPSVEYIVLALEVLYAMLYFVYFRPHFKLTCDVCCEEFEPSEGVACQHSDDEAIGVDYHMFCTRCAREYVARNVNDSLLAPNRDGMPCMQSDCKRPICPETLEEVVSDDVLTILKRRCFKESLWLAGVETCKNDSCLYGVVIEQNKRDRPAFECPVCNAYFCRTCKRDMFPLHIEATCKQLDRREALAENNNSVYNKMSEVVIRRCPRCAVGIIKADGCNMMTCRCGTTMCYLCRATPISEDHFRNGGRCQQFADYTERTMRSKEASNQSFLRWMSCMRCCISASFELTCDVCCEEFEPSEGIACQHSDDEKIGVDYHMFCAPCVRAYVIRNVNDAPLAPNRDGMPCMQSRCKRPIRPETLVGVLPDDVLTILKLRCAKESLWLAGVETCKNDTCSYGLVIEQDKRDRPAFECPVCNAYFCRTCKRDMFPLHIEATCKQLDSREAMAERHREGNNKLYNKMSDVVIRRCPRCDVGIVKDDGCNMMTCRCGMTMCYLCQPRNIFVRRADAGSSATTPFVTRHACLRLNRSFV